MRSLASKHCQGVKSGRLRPAHDFRLSHFNDGFTLLELIIALAIFSVVSVLAYGGLRSVQDTRNHVEESAGELARLQMAFTILSRDLRQGVARSIRDDFGDKQPAMIGMGSGFGNMLEFSRTGLRNPTGRPRSHLQRVAYGLKDNKFVRLSWPVLDRAQNSESAEMVLLEDVNSLELRFLHPVGRWQTEWPPLAADEEPEIPLPRAVEVSIEIEGWGRIVRLFRTPGASQPTTL